MSLTRSQQSMHGQPEPLNSLRIYVLFIIYVFQSTSLHCCFTEETNEAIPGFRLKVSYRETVLQVFFLAVP